MAINAPFETACRPGCGTHRKPLTTGDVRSGERGIRCWILGSDWLEAILALPEPRFGNTGISTYVWGLNNRKEKRRRNKLRLASLHPTAWRSMWGGGSGTSARRQPLSVSPSSSPSLTLHGASGRTRTCNLLIRSQKLYPIELRTHFPANPASAGSVGFARLKHKQGNRARKHVRYPRNPATTRWCRQTFSSVP